MDQSLNWIENFEIKQIQVVCFYKCKKMIILAKSLSYYIKKLNEPQYAVKPVYKGHTICSQTCI